MFPIERSQAPFRISPREDQILSLIGKGLSNGEIGLYLGISTSTVSQHMANLRLKFRVSTRTKLLISALRMGFVNPDNVQLAGVSVEKPAPKQRKEASGGPL